MKEQIQLSDHFTYGRLIRFTLPSIGMMIFMSIYSVVDGFFVSNYAGKTPFAALNLIFPFLMILSTLGFMFGTGGSALVGKTLGEGDNERANHYFSLFVLYFYILICFLNYCIFSKNWTTLFNSLLETSSLNNSVIRISFLKTSKSLIHLNLLLYLIKSLIIFLVLFDKK